MKLFFLSMLTQFLTVVLGLLRQAAAELAQVR